MNMNDKYYKELLEQYADIKLKLAMYEQAMEELDAIDDILSKKVLRKLESQNPVYVKSMADSLCNYLDELFGVDGMPLCKEYLRRLERSA